MALNFFSALWQLWLAGLPTKCLPDSPYYTILERVETAKDNNTKCKHDAFWHDFLSLKWKIWAFKVKKMNNVEEFCYLCQERSTIVLHTTVNCPKAKCKNCFQKGHTKKKCPLLLNKVIFRMSILMKTLRQHLHIHCCPQEWIFEGLPFNVNQYFSKNIFMNIIFPFKWFLLTHMQPKLVN